MTEYELAALFYQVVDVANASLKWHGFALGGAETDAKFIPRWVVSMSALAWFGTIWFFFHMRRKPAKTRKQ